MMAFGIVYSQYWLIVEWSFLLCLNVIKSTFCVARKTVDGIMIPHLLDSHMLSVQSSCLGSLCSTMSKGQWLNIQSWIQWPNYGWTLILFPFWVKNSVGKTNWQKL
jgi:hypothetical protein